MLGASTKEENSSHHHHWQHSSYRVVVKRRVRSLIPKVRDDQQSERAKFVVMHDAAPNWCDRQRELRGNVRSEFLDKPFWPHSISIEEVQQLNHIHSPLPRLALSDVRL